MIEIPSRAVEDCASPNHAMNGRCIPDIALRSGIRKQEIGAFVGPALC